jgi:hypothetical protein
MILLKMGRLAHLKNVRHLTEPQERTMTVLKLRGLTLKVASSCFEKVDSNEQVAAATRQGIMRIIFVT